VWWIVGPGRRPANESSGVLVGPRRRRSALQRTADCGSAGSTLDGDDRGMQQQHQQQPAQEQDQEQQEDEFENQPLPKDHAEELPASV